jgi:hypothetical protein
VVGGLMALNVGETPVPGRTVSPEQVFGPKGNANPVVKLLARASASLGAWAKPEYFELGKKGVEDAKDFLLADPAYRARLNAAGYSGLSTSSVRMDVRNIPESGLHPDIQGMDAIAEMLRRKARAKTGS